MNSGILAQLILFWPVLKTCIDLGTSLSLIPGQWLLDSKSTYPRPPGMHRGYIYMSTSLHPFLRSISVSKVGIDIYMCRQAKNMPKASISLLKKFFGMEENLQKAMDLPSASFDPMAFSVYGCNGFSILSSWYCADSWNIFFFFLLALVQERAFFYVQIDLVEIS